MTLEEIRRLPLAEFERLCAERVAIANRHIADMRKAIEDYHAGVRIYGGPAGQ